MLSESNRPLVLGIGGGSCSGKTRLSTALMVSLGKENCSVLRIDSYYDVPEQSGRIGFGLANFDQPDAVDFGLLLSHLRTLRAGEAVEVPRYDRKTNSREGTELVTPANVVVVEGLFALWHAGLRSELSHKLFLDVEADIRAVWRLLRDVAEYGTDIRDAARYYLSISRPMYDQFVGPSMAHADLVLRGTMPVGMQVNAAIKLMGLAISQRDGI